MISGKSRNSKFAGSTVCSNGVSEQMLPYDKTKAKVLQFESMTSGEMTFEALYASTARSVEVPHQKVPKMRIKRKAKKAKN
jgi:hypothetical protein